MSRGCAGATCTRIIISVSSGPESAAEELLAAAIEERLERAIAARRGLCQEVLEFRAVAQRVEASTACERRGHVIAAGDGATQESEPAFVLADVAVEPALLEDRLGILRDSQRGEARPDGH